MSFLTSLLKMLPDAAAQGLIWGILAIGVFITYKLLDFSDLTVDGSICTGGAVAALLIIKGMPVAVAMVAAFCAFKSVSIHIPSSACAERVARLISEINSVFFIIQQLSFR